ncbi:sulfotransferase domain-containing protein [Rubrivirga sp. IMCC45206]|uniref:sulfotransferase domain-containing protein n=1 Tax=Rubrivirga sp. IMCC45206 TaxID=3391614 RepID=UPI00398FF260
MSLVSTAVARFARSATAFRRRNPRFRHWVPWSVLPLIQAARSRMTEMRRLYLPVRHQARYRNVFHCCVQKTGSQWVKSVLLDPRAFEYSGYSHYHYRSRRVGDVGDRRRATEREIRGPFPERALVSPLYIAYDVYAAIPKEGETRAFFVMRDPRDLLVSWYFSARKNHVVGPDPTAPLATARAALAALDPEAGLKYAVDYFAERGRFDALASWADRGAADPDVLLVRYEDFVGPDSQGAFRRLFDHLDIQIPADTLAALLEAYSFERLSGRKRGASDPNSHLRSGRAGDWTTHFTPDVLAHYHAVAGDLAERLGYAPADA